MSEYRISLRVDITGGWPDTPEEENYYTPEQLAKAASGWIESSLWDRDDVHSDPIITILESPR